LASSLDNRNPIILQFTSGGSAEAAAASACARREACKRVGGDGGAVAGIASTDDWRSEKRQLIEATARCSNAAGWLPHRGGGGGASSIELELGAEQNCGFSWP